jgi:hypothetical protein
VAEHAAAFSQYVLHDVRVVYLHAADKYPRLPRRPS